MVSISILYYRVYFSTQFNRTLITPTITQSEIHFEMDDEITENNEIRENTETINHRENTQEIEMQNT